MTRRRRVPLWMTALFLCIPLLAQDSSKTRVLSLENAWNEAEGHNDANALAVLMAPTFVYTDADGEFMNKQQFLASIRQSSPSHIVNEAMKAESYGDTIVVTGTYREHGSENGKPFSHHGRFIDIWVQKDGQWFCVASHETLIAH